MSFTFRDLVFKKISLKPVGSQKAVTYSVLNLPLLDRKPPFFFFLPFLYYVSPPPPPPPSGSEDILFSPCVCLSVCLAVCLDVGHKCDQSCERNSSYSFSRIFSETADVFLSMSEDVHDVWL